MLYILHSYQVVTYLLTVMKQFLPDAGMSKALMQSALFILCSLYGC